MRAGAIIKRIGRADKLIRREEAKAERWGRECEAKREQASPTARRKYARALTNVERLNRAKCGLLRTLKGAW